MVACIDEISSHFSSGGISSFEEALNIWSVELSTFQAHNILRLKKLENKKCL